MVKISNLNNIASIATLSGSKATTKKNSLNLKRTEAQSMGLVWNNFNVGGPNENTWASV